MPPCPPSYSSFFIVLVILLIVLVLVVLLIIFLLLFFFLLLLLMTLRVLALQGGTATTRLFCLVFLCLLIVILLPRASSSWTWRILTLERLPLVLPARKSLPLFPLQSLRPGFIVLFAIGQGRPTEIVPLLSRLSVIIITLTATEL
jgi:hypothetical protein